MLQKQDNLVIFVLIIIALIWLIRLLYIRFVGTIPKEIVDPNDEVVQLLSTHGYSTIQRKIKVPISISVTNDEVLEARYYIDAIARKDGFTYAVRVGNPKRPMEITNTSIRDKLFPIYLLASWDGVLYIDKEQRKVTLYTFHYDSYLLPRKKQFLAYFCFFLFGIFIAFLIL